MLRSYLFHAFNTIINTQSARIAASIPEIDAVTF